MRTNLQEHVEALFFFQHISQEAPAAYVAKTEVGNGPEFGDFAANITALFTTFTFVLFFPLFFEFALVHQSMNRYQFNNLLIQYFL